MAFEKSLADIVASQGKAYEDLEKKLNAEALKIFQSASRACLRVFENLANDPLLHQSLSKITKFAGKSGKDAADAWMKGWQTNIHKFNRLMSKVEFASLDMEQRMKKLAQRKTMGWSPSARYAQLELQTKDSIDKQLALHNKAIDKLKYDKTKVNAKNISPAEKIAEKAALDQRINAFKNMNAQLTKARDNVDGLGKKMQTLAMEEKLQDFHDKATGGIRNKFVKAQDGWQMIKHLISNPAALAMVFVSAIVMIFKALWDEVRAGMRVFRDAGQIPAQWVSSMGRAVETQKAMLKKGLIMDMKEAAQVVSSMQENLGMVKLPSLMTEQSAYMTRMFAMSEQQSTQFLTTMYRFFNRNSAEATRISNQVAVFAVKNNANVNQLMSDMNAHANDFAMSGRMAADAFAEAALDARRIGYSMASVTGLANKLVGDFEGALRTQAELSTFFPGMDMSELMYSSQFGDMNQIRASMENMLSGIDMKNMPRSFKLMLTRNLGMSASEIANIAGGEARDYQDADLNAQIDASQAMLQSVFKIGDEGISTIIKLLKQIVAVVTLGGLLPDGVSDDRPRANTPSRRASVIDLPQMRAYTNTMNQEDRKRQDEVLGELKKLNQNMLNGQNVVVEMDSVRVGRAIVGGNSRNNG